MCVCMFWKSRKWQMQISGWYLHGDEERGSVQFSCSSCPILWDPVDSSTPGFPVHHQLPELAQTHVHLVSDAIQPSHPLSSHSPPAFNLSQNQGLFQWISSSHQVAKGLEFQLQHQSFQWLFRTDFLQDRLVGSPCYPRDSQESSQELKASTLQGSAFFMIQVSHPYMLVPFCSSPCLCCNRNCIYNRDFNNFDQIIPPWKLVLRSTYTDKSLEQRLPDTSTIFLCFSAAEANK